MIDTDDRLNQTCTKCGVGDYQETSIHDDWDGVLHCTNKKCNHEVKRYKSDDNPQPTHQMTLNKEQFSKLVENYASHIIEGLDSASLELMVFDLLVSAYENYSDEEILGEIGELYGEEVAQDFYNDVTLVEVAQDP